MLKNSKGFELSSKYNVGDLVNVCVNTENDAFDGLILAKGSVNGWWYQVRACNPADMPGKFWFRESKIVKLYKQQEEKATVASKPVGT